MIFQLDALTSIGLFKSISGSKININNIDTTDINKIYTLINGKWVSWIKGIPDAYQGFTTFDQGRGYIIIGNVGGSLLIPDTGTVVNKLYLPLTIGWNVTALPETGTFSNTIYGYINIDKAYTLINGQWKSWIDGVPDMYQGFTNIQTDKGYVLSVLNLIGKVFGNSAFPYMVTFGMLTSQIVPQVITYSDYSDTLALALDE